MLEARGSMLDGRASERLSILQVDCCCELRHFDLMEKNEATNHRAPKAKLHRLIPWRWKRSRRRRRGIFCELDLATSQYFIYL